MDVDAPYAAHLVRLLPARRAGIVFGLERIGALLARLGHPERRLGVVVQVGGTNGKGSTVAMLAALVRAGRAGRVADGRVPRVGVYTSPHLVSVCERVAVDGVAMSQADFVAAADVVVAAGGDALTFFEQLTALALVHLAGQQLDVTLLEVGLGGRLDATTAVPAAVAVITGVALDHQDLLGAELRAIAGEKAGILRPGQRVVIGASGLAEAVPWLAAAATAAPAAALTVVDDDAVAAVPATLTLAGAHQRRNAAAALAALDHLEALGVVHAPAAARAAALAAVVHPGRFEVVRTAPWLVLDGAHNPHGAAALAEALMSLPRPRRLIMAVSADKDVDAMIAALAPAVDEVVCTRYQQARALAPAALAVRWAALAPACVVTCADDVVLALAAPSAAATTVVAGSLMLVGEARAHLLGLVPDPVVVSDPPGRLSR
ncbi:MAG: bifunctional folylpolyglutamate synthase/dihydrofolate synthase [Kofleriaceae bacterium]|nr:bifunctional folylpolyglutamate synthase/dihydrofolate synthase [Kofleriaceae bacterium]